MKKFLFVIVMVCFAAFLIKLGLNVNNKSNQTAAPQNKEYSQDTISRAEDITLELCLHRFCPNIDVRNDPSVNVAGLRYDVSQNIMFRSTEFDSWKRAQANATLYLSDSSANIRDNRNWTVRNLSLAVVEESGDTSIWRLDSRNKPAAELLRQEIVDIWVSGIEFKIAEKTPSAIRLITRNRLSLDEHKRVIEQLKYRYSTIQFGTFDAPGRGEDYAAYDGNYYYDYKAGKTIKAKDF